MARYRYKARDKAGSVMTGILESSGRDEAAMQLDQMGYLPVRIQESTGWEWRESLKALEESLTQVTPQDKIILTRQMATLIDAGLSFVAVFDALIDQTPNPRLRSILTQVRRDVEGGMRFSDSLGKHPAVFDTLYVSMVHAGEEAGALDEMLNRLASLAEHDAEVRARIKSATRYPKIVIVALVAAFIVLTVFVLPRFTAMYAQFNATLPLPTRIMIGISNLVQSHGLVVLTAAVGAFVGAGYYVRSESGRPAWDALKLKLPIFGPIFLKSALSKFARVFGTLNRCGLPALRALEIVSKTVNNIAVSRAIDVVQDGARQGKGLVQPMRSTKLFPSGVLQMVAIGEDTGQLEPMLMKVSEYYDREVDYSLRTLATSIEPLLLAVIGGGVLFLALAIFLPWWNLIHVVKGGG